MSISEYIIMPISGAVIGYFTNWIAIKMLFRPHNEIHVMGFKLPFTPGLIPKERYNLSLKVGKTLSENVLTDDVMLKSLNSPEMNEKVSNIVSDVIDKLFENDKSIRKNITMLLGNEANEQLDKLPEIISNEAIKRLTEGAICEKAAIFLYGKATEIFKNPEILKPFSDKTMKQILPEQWSELTSMFAKQKLPELVNWIRSIPETYPALDNSLRVLVKNIAEENFGKLIGIFVNYDKIYDNIKTQLFLYLEKPENQDILLERVLQKLEELSEKSVADIYMQLPENAKLKLKEVILSFLENDVQRNTLTIKLENIILEEVKRSVQPFLEKHINRLLDIPVCNILSNISDVQREFIKSKAMTLISVVLQKGGGYVVNSLEFDKIVENKLNDFSVGEAESIILSVVKKELNAITTVGGVLGFIIGMLPAVLAAAGLS